MSGCLPGKCRCGEVSRFTGVDSWGDFWKAVVEKSNQSHCMALDLSKPLENADLKEKIKVPSGLSRYVGLFLGVINDGELELEIELGRGSEIKLRVFQDLRLGEGQKAEFDLDIKSTQIEPGSFFMYRGRIVCEGNVEFETKSLGHLGASSDGSICEHDTKVLKIGAKPEIEGRPVLEVLNKNVKATHGFSVDSVPSDVMQYMLSRGLREKEAVGLYAKGFLAKPSSC